jgi:hypothetical protein
MNTSDNHSESADATLDRLQAIVDAAPIGANIWDEVERGVATFEVEFANDPFAGDYLEIGVMAHGTFDGRDTTVEAIAISEKIFKLMQREKTARPNAYRRKAIVQKIQLALTLCNVPSSINANQLIPLRWVVALCQSTVQVVDGKEERTFAGVDVNQPGWIAGKLTLHAIRKLCSCINRVNRNSKDEVDLWDFNPGFPGFRWEPFVRRQVERLRREDISTRQLVALVDAHSDEIKKAEKEAAERLLDKQQREDLEIKRLRDAEEAKRGKLGDMIGAAQDYAIRELKYDKDDLQAVLVRKGAIPPPVKLNNKDFAANMVPGDAKAFVECLFELIEGATDPADRERYLKVLRVLHRTAAEAVKRLEPAKKDQPALKRA